MAVRKQRLDKYYNMAKEKGYRARSAFKLLELDRKFNLLSNVHIAVDLCAAPGGWMQILAQEMAAPRKIIGIDLDPIKPLGSDTVSYVGDITTVDCRRTLIRHLEGHHVDIFVHDGAPNFGASKERDTFVQNDLVLHALRLTCEFLKTGGTFVTKIFRSENFMKIVKVLESLFDTVDITKPLSSRNESAEIFAVCRKFKNPEEIDPSIFNSEVLFYDDSINKEENRKILLSEYVMSKSNKVLKECSKMIVDMECELITEEHVEMFKDLKMLHDTDFRKLARMKMKIIKGVRSGEYDIPQLAGLVESESEEAVETTEDKLDEIERKMKRRERPKKQKALSLVATARQGFFSDRIFESFEVEEAAEVADEAVEERVSVSSCSESMESLTPSELECLVMMKKMGDGFEEATIDRNAVDDDDIVLPCEKRVAKCDEFNRIPKKVREYMNRKRTRAQRRAEKVMADIEVENEEEEAVIYKKVFKNQYKKQRDRLRLLFPKGRGRIVAPKGKGKVKCLDGRMKHDLRMAKRRKQHS